MPRLPEVIEELQFLSTQLSIQVRTIALGLLAVSWGLLIGSSPVALEVVGGLRTGLLRVGLLAILVLLLDLAQYVCAYRNVYTTLRAAEARGRTEVTYNPHAWLYRLRTWLFWSKLWLILGASGYFVALILSRVL